MVTGRSGKVKSDAWAALVAAVLVSGIGAALSAQGSQVQGKGDPETDNWDRVSVDLSVRMTRVDKNGKLTGPAAPDVAYRWQRDLERGAWKTTFTLLSRARPVVQSIDGPRELDIASDRMPVRIEDDEDGSPLRFYNARGKQIEVPAEEALRGVGRLELPRRPIDLPAGLGADPRPRVTGREWVQTLLVPTDRKEARQKALEQRFGRARGQVRGLDQFVVSTGSGQQELLVDREFAVPVEINVIRDGALVSHDTVSYERRPDGSLVRSGMRTEQLVPDDAADGGRIVSDIVLTNLRLEKRGGPR